ncbi:hypothetical protein [Neisseria gonorrhoeae]|uniref:hypothetical protein n=1 Tax=Neisseria gonorrhoeae TaxID=485 RepID=UPI0021D8C113|nr:hypothetical protein [Neisseria gonorrhoeae]UYA77910.1 hypothetical protein LLE38_10145 [Neisseria gonorrhoeae]
MDSYHPPGWQATPTPTSYAETQSDPQLVYETKFAFGQQGLQRNGNKLDIYEDKSRDNSPIYKLKDYPWLGVSFNLGSENTVKNGRSSGRLISSFSENNNNQTIVSTTRDRPISLGDRQREHTAVACYLNAKLHLLDKKGLKISPKAKQWIWHLKTARRDDRTKLAKLSGYVED